MLRLLSRTARVQTRTVSKNTCLGARASMNKRLSARAFTYSSHKQSTRNTNTETNTKKTWEKFIKRPPPGLGAVVIFVVSVGIFFQNDKDQRNYEKKMKQIESAVGIKEKKNYEEQEECVPQPTVADTHGAAMTEDEKMMAETLDRITQIESSLGIKKDERTMKETLDNQTN